MSHSLRSAWIEIEADTTVFGYQEVALLTECVDRNLEGNLTKYYDCVMSHSLRSAWIEIQSFDEIYNFLNVALLTECVDRNCSFCQGLEIRYGRTPYGVRG